MPMADPERRSFLARYVREELCRAAAGFCEGVREVREEAELDSFFESYETSYALTLAYPDELVLESARREGIEVEGRERKDVLRDLFRKTRRL